MKTIFIAAVLAVAVSGCSSNPSRTYSQPYSQPYVSSQKSEMSELADMMWNYSMQQNAINAMNAQNALNSKSNSMLNSGPSAYQQYMQRNNDGYNCFRTGPTTYSCNRR